jgi:hypothetical protein
MLHGICLQYVAAALEPLASAHVRTATHALLSNSTTEDCCTTTAAH